MREIAQAVIAVEAVPAILTGELIQRTLDGDNLPGRKAISQERHEMDRNARRLKIA
jgi:hypothetical protein